MRGLLGNGASANLQISNGQVVNTPSLTTTITNQTTTAVTKALETYKACRCPIAAAADRPQPQSSDHP